MKPSLRLIFAFILLFQAASIHGAEIIAADYPSLQAAVKAAQPGDTVIFPGGVVRESVTLSNKHDLIIEGNGTILDGADPLSADGWEAAGEGMHRRKMRRTMWDRNLLIFGDRAERMGRTPGNKLGFPKLEELKEGQFAFVNLDEEEGWLYVKGPIEDLSWSRRINGLATSGECSNIVVRNLKARHFLNDGFNIHGHAVGMRFEKIEGTNNFDEGFSAHDTCECWIDGGIFLGNEHAVADVNSAITHYRNCLFSDSVTVDVLLAGVEHSLTDCIIRNRTKAKAIQAGSRGKEPAVFLLKLERVQILGERPDGEPSQVRVNNGTLEIVDCEIVNSHIDATGAELVEK